MAFSFPITTDEQAHLVAQVYQRLKNKRSADYEAGRLGLAVSDYLLIREHIDRHLSAGNIEDRVESWLLAACHVPHANAGPIAEFITPSANPASQTHRVSLLDPAPASALTEQAEDFAKGTQMLKGISVTKPRTPEEIIALLEIDTERWTLKNYWNKEKNGRWEISALVAKKNHQDLDAEGLAAIQARVFSALRLRPVQLPVVRAKAKCLVIYPSDKHIGASVSEVAMYGNPYSDAEYEARMQVVLQETLALAATMGPFERIIIADMGDKLDGYKAQTTRGGHTLPQSGSDRSNYETCLRVEKQFFDQLLQSGAAASYQVYQNTNSNHGGDFEYFASRDIENYLNVRYPQVKTFVQEQFITHFHYGIHAILLTHGKDTEEMKHGLPRHLSDKAENLLNKYLMFHNINPQETVISLVKGDLHVNASEYTSSLRYRNCASLFGGSKWIQTNFGPCTPGCSFDIYERDSPRVLEGLMQFQPFAGSVQLAA